MKMLWRLNTWCSFYSLHKVQLEETPVPSVKTLAIIKKKKTWKDHDVYMIFQTTRCSWNWCLIRPFILLEGERNFSLFHLFLMHYDSNEYDMNFYPYASHNLTVCRHKTSPTLSKLVFFVFCFSATTFVWTSQEECTSHYLALGGAYEHFTHTPPNRNSSPRATSWTPAEESLFWCRRFASNVRLPSSSNVLCSCSSNRLYVNCREPDGKQRSRRRAESDQKKDFSVSVSVRTNVKLVAKC